MNLTVTEPKSGLLAPCAAKPIYWHRVVVQGASKEKGQLMLKRLELPDGFQSGVLKTTLGMRVTGCAINSWTFFWLVGGEITGWCTGNLNHQSPGSSQSGWGLCAGGQHVVNILHLVGGGGGPSFCRTTQRYVRLLSLSLQEELGVLWLYCSSYYYFSCLPAFFVSTFSTSLIINCLSLLFGTWGRPRRGKLFLQTGSGRHGGACTQEGPAWFHYPCLLCFSW